MKIQRIIALLSLSACLIGSACTRAGQVKEKEANTSAVQVKSPRNGVNANAEPSPTPTGTAVTQAAGKEKQEIFDLVKQDEYVASFITDSPQEARNLIKELIVRKVDLNADDQPEYVAVVENGFLCGVRANCPHWIFSKKGTGYQLLRHTNAQVIKLEKTSSNGYRDLRASSGDTASTNSHAVFRYDGRKYQPVECVSRDESKKPAKETRIDCADMGEEKR